ncbi:carbonic anhydrase family protein [bacterium]|nr:carbonic anhydrase family protein [bacterium]
MMTPIGIQVRAYGLPAAIFSVALAITGCAQSDPVPQVSEVVVTETVDGVEPLVNRVLTEEEQNALEPGTVLTLLQEGNQRFMAGNLTARDHTEQVRDAAMGQFPKAVILSCLDSRIPVEDVFDRGIGDIFVARVAGNFANIDILGSMEFGCKVSGAKLVLVLGHAGCGAIAGAIDGVELGNITPMLANIKPAMAYFGDYSGEKTSANKVYMDMVTEQNVVCTMEYIRKNSPILERMETEGQIAIVGGVYDMHTGEVRFLK